MGGEILNGKKRNHFFEEYPMFTVGITVELEKGQFQSFLGNGLSIRLEEKTGTTIGVVLIRAPTILFYSVTKKNNE